MHCSKTKTKNGQVRWVCVEDSPRDSATGKRKQITRRGKTQKEAKKRVETAIKDELETGINHKETKDMTFDKLADEWLEMYKLTGVKKSTINTRKVELKALNDHIAKAQVSKIDHFMYQKVINDIAVERTENYVRGVNVCANMVFKFGVKSKIIKLQM
ncbi:tyrosine-type recombinase/integrase [Virgibacillus litoralis]|uniref:Core-binding (CB) domain-containing protein n=1 Tax=Virgibacillus litoralis TaxID=578221 RepID=A0ABS4HDG3_9BACI|nr:Arm DNA-binding domain-containing protein [Virgibacillus litoralis]MBP1948482.1 hypothetical protein [Virgibacillus litoralis]